jgi:3-mercaptopyruvate sulfurtransferase SseA
MSRNRSPYSLEQARRLGEAAGPSSARDAGAGRVWPRRSIVTHCEGGGRAALGSTAAVRAGFDDIRVYYLSFVDWVRNESCPVVRD